MKILFLSRWFPYPPSNGSKLRIYNLIRGLASCHEVTLLSFAEPTENVADASELSALCQKVEVVTRKSFKPDSFRAQMGFLSLKPRSVVDTFSTEMKDCISQALQTGSYDLVIASQVDMAIYSPYFQHIPAVFEEVEVGVPYENFTQAESLQRRFRAGLTWAKHRRYLKALLRNFQLCTVVSDQERSLLQQAIPDSPAIEVVPNGVDLAGYRKFHGLPTPNTLIFTGSFSYQPNYQAMVWFLDEVYAQIQTEVPEIQLSITGKHGNLPLPPATNVHLTGFVDDVRPLIADSWISLVPIHSGGGTRLKVLEAMALGTPVVSTSKGAEGLAVKDGEHLLMADTPKAFGQAVIRLLRDEKLRKRLVNNAYQLIQTYYDWDVVMPGFLSLIEGVSHRPYNVLNKVTGK